MATKLRGTDLAIYGMIVLGGLGITCGLVAMIIAAVAGVDDADLMRQLTSVCLIGGTAVTLLGGFIGGYHLGQAEAKKPPEIVNPPTGIHAEEIQ